jgi:hypothetical protein
MTTTVLLCTLALLGVLAFGWRAAFGRAATATHDDTPRSIFELEELGSLG